MRPLTDQIIGWARKGVVPAAIKIAAAMEESGLGEHTPPGSNNWFGIKGDGPAVPTREETAAGHWYTIKSGFKMFASPGAGFDYYDWLISHGSPYSQAWKVWLASKQDDAAVERLTKDIALHYASALKYATDLITLEEKDRLFEYDLTEQKAMATQSPANAPQAAFIDPKPASRAQANLAGAAPAPSHPAPPIGGTVKIDIGDRAEALIDLGRQFVEQAIAAGEPILLENVPRASDWRFRHASRHQWIYRSSRERSRESRRRREYHRRGELDHGCDRERSFCQGTTAAFRVSEGQREPLFAEAIAAIKKL